MSYSPTDPSFSACSNMNKIYMTKKEQYEKDAIKEYIQKQ